MREFFDDQNFQDDTLALIEKANRILETYKSQGLRLTLRQLFYQMVARDMIPNTQRSYKRLGQHVGNARLAGLIDWAALEDRARYVESNSHWSGPAEILDSAASSFQINKWDDQPNHVLVMVEKDALSGVIAPVCANLDVPFTANRGYASLSHLYDIGRGLRSHADQGKEIHVLYLGDHDPSGLDMDRDLLDRLTMFAQRQIRLHRLALTMDQIDQYQPPPNPAKVTDSRASEYIALYGDNSWELDALEPRVLQSLVEEAVIDLRDDGLWDEAIDREDRMVTDLNDLAAEYEEIEY